MRCLTGEHTHLHQGYIVAKDRIQNCEGPPRPERGSVYPPLTLGGGEAKADPISTLSLAPTPSCDELVRKAKLSRCAC